MQLHLAAKIAVSNYPLRPIPRMIPPWKGKARAREILQEIAETYNVTVADILSRARRKELVVARHHAMWRVRTSTTLSFPQMARIFQRDHTSVIYGVKAHELRCETR